MDEQLAKTLISITSTLPKKLPDPQIHNLIGNISSVTLVNTAGKQEYRACHSCFRVGAGFYAENFDRDVSYDKWAPELKEYYRLWHSTIFNPRTTPFPYVLEYLEKHDPLWTTVERQNACDYFLVSPAYSNVHHGFRHEHWLAFLKALRFTSECGRNNMRMFRTLVEMGGWAPSKAQRFILAHGPMIIGTGHLHIGLFGLSEARLKKFLKGAPKKPAVISQTDSYDASSAFGPVSRTSAPLSLRARLDVWSENGVVDKEVHSKLISTPFWVDKMMESFPEDYLKIANFELSKVEKPKEEADVKEIE